MDDGKEYDLVFQDDSTIQSEQAAIDAIFEALDLEEVAFCSDEAEFWMFVDEGNEDILKTALPVPVEAGWTLLQGLAKIRELYPRWPETERKLQ
jgi:hypothetical protein